MKDPEQMSKHELVQEVYKLAGMNQELVSVEELQDVINDCMDNTPESEDWLSDLQTKIAKEIHNLLRGAK